MLHMVSLYPILCRWRAKLRTCFARRISQLTTFSLLKSIDDDCAAAGAMEPRCKKNSTFLPKRASEGVPSVPLYVSKYSASFSYKNRMGNRFDRSNQDDGGKPRVNFFSFLLRQVRGIPDALSCRPEPEQSYDTSKQQDKSDPLCLLCCIILLAFATQIYIDQEHLLTSKLLTW